MLRFINKIIRFFAYVKNLLTCKVRTGFFWNIFFSGLTIALSYGVKTFMDSNLLFMIALLIALIVLVLQAAFGELCLIINCIKKFFNRELSVANKIFNVVNLILAILYYPLVIGMGYWIFK